MECTRDSECNDNQVCYEYKCIDACLYDNPCAVNAICEGSRHTSQCSCPPGYFGDPRERCLTVECRIHDDCPNDKACYQNQCHDPCLIENPCAPTAICSTNRHTASCSCPPGLVGDPFVQCAVNDPIPTIDDPDCEVDSDCPSGRACINDICVNPCYTLSPCDATAICSVVDTVPFRTMICSCREGWQPDTDRSCVPVDLPNPPGCRSDDECSVGEACINRACKNPCDCGTGADCFLADHVPVCRCPEGTIGDPQIACVPPGCQRNEECSDREMCVDGTCINPCLIEDPCGPNAECYPQIHVANCRCLEGYEPDPTARDGCRPIGCRSDPECPDNQACDVPSGDCYDPCIANDPCGQNAECLVSQHLDKCRCRFGYTGDPYRACVPFAPPECVQDSDCNTGLVCLDETCVDPCIELTPCVAPSTCRVIDSSPIRFMTCVCPDGYVSTDDGGCATLPPIVSGCEKDDECPESTACINAVCRDPCACGLNAHCEIVNHRPVCTCNTGYYGDPKIRCDILGCTSDSECKETHACRQGDCTPVCGPDGLPCGGNSECNGIAHQPVCTCPAGLTGDPYQVCSSKSCRDNSECPIEQECINKICQDTCAIENPCDPTAECRIKNHEVDCSCPPGFTGSRRPGERCEKGKISQFFCEF